MRTFFLLLIITVFAIHAQAQLNGTKWKTILQLDQPMSVTFNFYNDTLNVSASDGSNDLETLKFSIQDTVLTLQKLFGQSDCDTTAKGTYSYKINGNELFLALIADDCSHRSDVIKDIKLEKVE